MKQWDWAQDTSGTFGLYQCEVRVQEQVDRSELPKATKRESLHFLEGMQASGHQGQWV